MVSQPDASKEEITMRKCKITVFDYTDATHNSPIALYDKEDPPNVVEYIVNAWCVGGETGVRAYFTLGSKPGLLFTAHGDDGHWWLDNVIAIRWLPEMMEAMTAIIEEDKS